MFSYAGDVVGIEMGGLEKKQGAADSNYRPTKKKGATQWSYMSRFESILKPSYQRKKAWWDAVGEQLKIDREFERRVSRYIYMCIHAQLCMHVSMMIIC